MNFPCLVEWPGLSPGAVLRNGLAAPGNSAFVRWIRKVLASRRNLDTL